MKWVLLGKRHINTNNVSYFKWDHGTLFVYFNVSEGSIVLPDPDKKLYRKMCKQQGIRPYEEE